MRCYLITTGDVKRYAGTAAEAKTTREAMMLKTGLKKKDISIEDAEVPTAKPLLLEFINKLCEEADYADDK